MSEFFYGPTDSFDEIEELEEIEENKRSFLDNAKLIGDTPTGIQVYLEDYVYTYLYQYAKLNRGEEKGAALVGYYTEEFGEKMAIISGAIQFKHSLSEDRVLLTDEVMNEVRAKLNKYFPDCELMGWMHTQPGYGIFLTTQDIRLQKQFFGKPYQTLMIIDPIENIEAFFLWDKEEVRSAEGYYIYYEKNEQMQNYMVNHKVGVSNEELQEKEDVVIHFRKKDRAKRQEIQNKKITRLVVSLSVVLFLMCVSMAVGLIQNRERLARLETELNHMDKNYTNLLSQLQEKDVQVVFAETEDAIANEPQETPDIAVEETEDAIIIEEEPKEEVKQEAKEEAEKETEKAAEQASKPQQEPSYDTYTVKQGDNLNRICYQHYKTTAFVDEIVEVNKLESPDKIYEGQVLKLPRL
ncbi:MAG: LysM peptidoglycan-binding domain-containing protein [Epulopiscium sp.]|nr:LysM peptidoglycan-binding domain-containing protein [Candidatus Epulonipiscium sp.]